jgi:hypothetical protein
MMQTLAAIVVARDAARLIGPVLKNLRSFADEVLLVVDAATVDETAAMGAVWADTTVTWLVADSYEHVLNEAVALTHGDWVLHAHDDELWPPVTQGAIRCAMTAIAHADSTALPRRHIVEREGAICYIADAPLWPDHQVRLRTRRAWQECPWPRHVHGSVTPAGYLDAPIWHLKFMLKPQALREERLQAWGRLWPDALLDHYKRFSILEGYDYRLEPVPEAAPAEYSELRKP